MKTERPKELVKPGVEKNCREEFAPHPGSAKVEPQTKCACDPFEAILDSYARDPERWDGLE